MPEESIFLRIVIFAPEGGEGRDHSGGKRLIGRETLLVAAAVQLVGRPVIMNGPAQRIHAAAGRQPVIGIR